LTIGEQIRAGHPQEFGLRLGAQDWLHEEAILRACNRFGCGKVYSACCRNSNVVASMGPQPIGHRKSVS
jgi:hypothetical protein